MKIIVIDKNFCFSYSGMAIHLLSMVVLCYHRLSFIDTFFVQCSTPRVSAPRAAARLTYRTVRRRRVGYGRRVPAAPTSADSRLVDPLPDQGPAVNLLGRSVADSFLCLVWLVARHQGQTERYCGWSGTWHSVSPTTSRSAPSPFPANKQG
jgi:hypothetical protein